MQKVKTEQFQAFVFDRLVKPCSQEGIKNGINKERSASTNSSKEFSIIFNNAEI